MKKELIKIRNKLLVYSLIISISVMIGSCTEKDNIEENSFSKIKEKRIEYGK